MDTELAASLALPHMAIDWVRSIFGRVYAKVCLCSH